MNDIAHPGPAQPQVNASGEPLNRAGGVLYRAEDGHDLSLDYGVDNSIGKHDGIYPQRDAGRWDPKRGGRDRWQELQSVIAFSKTIEPGCGALLTLTIDRRLWADRDQVWQRWDEMSASDRDKTGLSMSELATMPVEEICYRCMSPRVSRLLSDRLNINAWCRVIEPQTKTGDGWIHWHVIADFKGTRWMHQKHDRPFIELRDLAHELRFWWQEKYNGGNVDVDFKVHRLGEQMGKYVAKYISKPWKALPPWLLVTEKKVRVVGYSSEAKERIQDKYPEPKDTVWESRQVKPRRRLIDRLASSGSSFYIIHKGQYRGSINVPFNVITLLARDMPELKSVKMKWPSGTETFRHVWEGQWTSIEDFNARVQQLIDKEGLRDFVNSWQDRVRGEFMHDWQTMQDREMSDDDRAAEGCSCSPAADEQTNTNKQTHTTTSSSEWVSPQLDSSSNVLPGEMVDRAPLAAAVRSGPAIHTSPGNG